MLALRIVVAALLLGCVGCAHNAAVAAALSCPQGQVWKLGEYPPLYEGARYMAWSDSTVSAYSAPLVRGASTRWEGCGREVSCSDEEAACVIDTKETAVREATVRELLECREVDWVSEERAGRHRFYWYRGCGREAKCHETGGDPEYRLSGVFASGLPIPTVREYRTWGEERVGRSCYALPLRGGSAPEP